MSMEPYANRSTNLLPFGLPYLGYISKTSVSLISFIIRVISEQESINKERFLYWVAFIPYISIFFLFYKDIMFNAMILPKNTSDLVLAESLIFSLLSFMIISSN